VSPNLGHSAGTAGRKTLPGPPGRIFRFDDGKEMPAAASPRRPEVFRVG